MTHTLATLIAGVALLASICTQSASAAVSYPRVVGSGILGSLFGNAAPLG